MKIQHHETKLVFTKRNHRNALIVPMAMLCLSGSFLAACGKKEDSAATPALAPPPIATQGAASTTPNQETVKGTPEQEAAKQRAVNEGAAIQAANDPAAHPANDPNQGGK